MDTDTDLSESTGLRMSLRERPRKLHAERRLRSDDLSYLDDYETEKTSRPEKRKLKRKLNANTRCLYDEVGRMRHNGKDICDCMDDDCPGCWYECENCGSTKCGVQCRVHRKFYYESISFDGKDATIRNKHFPVGK
ncbi:ARL14 effector protein-like [Musca vetustissima]|uniref:ARL14 effector protein-like n=1 Tax=Musca vetustissima TaxID=27455 RepID=UPI002AB717AF|nr:ARL14 effector protein-like [Musca vetustissima]